MRYQLMVALPVIDIGKTLVSIEQEFIVSVPFNELEPMVAL